MKNGLNHLEIIGNVGKDGGVLGSLPSGVAVVNFSVAVNETWKDSDGNEKNKTEWIQVRSYGKRAQALAPHIKAGMTVFCSGRVGVNAWTSGEGQVKGQVTLTLGDGRNNFLFLSGGKNNEEIPNILDEDESLFVEEEK